MTKQNQGKYKKAKTMFFIQNNDRQYQSDKSEWEQCLSRHQVDLRTNHVEDEEDAAATLKELISLIDMGGDPTQTLSRL